MGQATILKFLQKYKKSKAYHKKKWLTAKEIYERMKNNKDSSGLGSVTTSIKKLRDSDMIKYKKLSIKKCARMILHYQSE